MHADRRGRLAGQDAADGNKQKNRRKHYRESFSTLWRTHCVHSLAAPHTYTRFPQHARSSWSCALVDSNQERGLQRAYRQVAPRWWLPRQFFFWIQRRKNRWLSESRSGGTTARWVCVLRARRGRSVLLRTGTLWHEALNASAFLFFSRLSAVTPPPEERLDVIYVHDTYAEKRNAGAAGVLNDEGGGGKEKVAFFICLGCFLLRTRRFREICGFLVGGLSLPDFVIRDAPGGGIPDSRESFGTTPEKGIISYENWIR